MWELAGKDVFVPVSFQRLSVSCHSGSEHYALNKGVFCSCKNVNFLEHPGRECLNSLKKNNAGCLGRSTERDSRMRIIERKL